MKAEGTGVELATSTTAEKVPPRRLSRIFEELAQSADNKVSIERIRDALGDRSFATLLVFFACINMLPFPPGSTMVLGIPLVLLSIQMTMGYRTAWLPRFILKKSLGADKFRHMSARLIPRIRWLENWIRPRYWPFARDHADRIIGLIALVLAVAVVLPIPLGNWFPAFSCALVGLALSERDGVLLGIAVASGALSLLLMAAVVGAAGALANALFG